MDSEKPQYIVGYVDEQGNPTHILQGDSTSTEDDSATAPGGKTLAALFKARTIHIQHPGTAIYVNGKALSTLRFDGRLLSNKHLKDNSSSIETPGYGEVLPGVPGWGDSNE